MERYTGKTAENPTPEQIKDLFENNKTYFWKLAEWYRKTDNKFYQKEFTPFFNFGSSKSNLSNSSRTALIVICSLIGMFILVLIISLFNTESTTSINNSEPVNSSWNGSVYQVEGYLKNSLKDPDSYEGIEWSKVANNRDGTYKVRHKYRAKNSFGGYVIENKVFILDKEKVINVYDY